MPTRDLDRICEIAARLHEDGERLRQLGLDHAARLLAAAEAALDARVYATGGRQDILFGEMVFGRPARLRRVKGREASSHQRCGPTRLEMNDRITPPSARVQRASAIISFNRFSHSSEPTKGDHDA